MHGITDRKQLYNRVVYLYFCFFSMYIADKFSMSVAYGAALYFSISAVFRIARFSSRTQGDPIRLKGLKAVSAVFFILAAAYTIGLYPFLFPYRHTAYAIAIIVLPLIEREAENILLRRRRKTVSKRGILRTIIPLEIACAAVAGAASLAAGLQVFYIVTAAVAAGMAFGFFRQYVFEDYSADYPVYAAKGFEKARSARLYDGMVITSGAALNLFAFTYILYIMFSGTHDFFFDFFVVFGGLSLLFTMVYLATYRAAGSALIQKIGKNAAFVLGTAISIFAVYVFRDSWYKAVISLQTALLLAGLTLQMTAITGLMEDVLLVLKLYDPDIDDATVAARSARLSLWTSVISEGVFIAVLLVIISNPLFYNMTDVRQYIEYAPYIGSSVAVIPTAFLIISLVYSLKQPLTKKYGRRLKVYSRIAAQGKSNPDMERRLESVLVRRYKKRIGVYIIRAFLKGIMYHTVEGKENVLELPGVFVFNHGELYGPVAAVVFLPYDIRPWILNKMIDKEEIIGHMYEGTFSRIKWLPACFKKLIAGALSPIIVWALRSFDPIPVYRGAAREVLQTFELSVECLNSGDSILLFPENPDAEYGAQISEFYSGFANLGRMYFRKTGKAVVFYPVFASRKSRTLRIGEGVKYDPGGGRDERDRIVNTLEHRMAELQKKDEA